MAGSEACGEWKRGLGGEGRDQHQSRQYCGWFYYNTRWTGNFCLSRPHQFGQFVCRFLFLFLETQGQYKARLNQYCVLVLPESYLIHESCTERRNLLYAHFSTFGLQMSSSMTWSSSTSLKSWTRSKMERNTICQLPGWCPGNFQWQASLLQSEVVSNYFFQSWNINHQRGFAKKTFRSDITVVCKAMEFGLYPLDNHKCYLILTSCKCGQLLKYCQMIQYFQTSNNICFIYV